MTNTHPSNLEDLRALAEWLATKPLLSKRIRLLFYRTVPGLEAAVAAYERKRGPYELALERVARLGADEAEAASEISLPSD